VRRAHDVSVLEASARTGGHVFTFREGLDDGLYADGGAEHFTQPGYEKFWSYVREFNLPYLYYPRREHLLRRIDGRMYTPEMLADPKVLGELGLNRREIDFLGEHPFAELSSLYLGPYLDGFADEYRPFDAGLNALDQISSADLFRKDGASAGALRFIGGRGSALQAVWHAAILKRRGVPLFPPTVFRLVGAIRPFPIPSRRDSAHASSCSLRSRPSNTERRVYGSTTSKRGRPRGWRATTWSARCRLECCRSCR
jgi:monoamine oxidase